MGSSILSIPGVTALATFEAYALTKLYPSGLFTKWQPGDVSSRITTILIIFAINYTIFLIYWDVIWPSFISPLQNIPRPKWWRVQIVYQKIKKTQGETLAALFHDTPNNGILAIRELTSTSLLVTDPSLLSDLLVHRSYDFEKAENTRNFLREILGDGLVIIEGDQHKFVRKHTQPAFGFRPIKNLYPMMWGKSLLCTEAIESATRLRDESSECTTDMLDWANKATLDIIGVAGMGRDVNVLQNGHDQIAEDYEAIFEPAGEKVLYILLAAWFSFPMVRMLPWKMNGLFKARTTSLRASCKQLVASKRKQIKEQDKDHFDILSVLIQTDKFSDQELSDQLLTFLAAGHDTTASTLTWACYLLALDQMRQDKLRREIQDALAGQPLDAQDTDIGSILERLPFLNAVVSETLRLYPTVPVTTRVAIRDTHLKEQCIPKGTEVLVSPWVMNRSKKFWGETAEIFTPERWIKNGQSDDPESENSGSNYNFLTFLHGPRSCIGQNFAKAEVRCLLAAIALRFSWTLDMDEKDVVPAGAITIKPANGLRLRLKRVQKTNGHN